SVITKFLRKHEIPFQRIEPYPGRVNIVVDVLENGDGPHLHWNAHMDTFAGQTNAASLARVVDGRIYGRGAVDMKGGLAAFLTAAVSLRSSEEVRSINGKVSFSIVCDE